MGHRDAVYTALLFASACSYPQEESNQLPPADMQEMVDASCPDIFHQDVFPEYRINEVDPDGRFRGVREIGLDMPRTDGSFLRHRPALYFLRRPSVTAHCPKTARLTINGEYYGLYTNLENLDTEFLQRVYEDKVLEDLVNRWSPPIADAAADAPMKPFTTSVHKAALASLRSYPRARTDAVGKFLDCGMHGGPAADGDGFESCFECLDENVAVNPDASEVCNGQDDDCDGLVDEAEGGQPCWRDA